MILQSLVDLYDRRASSPDLAERPAPVGFEAKAIAFVVEIDEEGHLVQIADCRYGDGKHLTARPELVPQAVKKTSGIAADVLWGTAEYVFGCPVEREGKAFKPERLRAQHGAFRERIESLPEQARGDHGVIAVLAFLDRLNLDDLAKLPCWDDIRATNPLVSFRLHGDAELVCQRPAVRRAWLEQLAAGPVDGVCLVTGEPAVVERLHPSIKGVYGAQTSGANIVSFNLDSFSSFGRSQGANAPVGVSAAARYTTALNDLLARNSRQRIQVGDASVVFWAERDSKLENDFLLMIGEPRKDDPSQGTDQIRATYESVRSGSYLRDVDGTVRFFVLGLAPNAARLSVRFWHVLPVANLVRRFQRWFDDIAIDHSPAQPDCLSLFRMLTACAAQGKAENIPPSLGADILRAILTGTQYPRSWLQAAVRRARAERTVDYARAAGIKACLNGQADQDEEKLTVSLDPTNTQTAYRLGRLFAVLERIQEEANPGLNATIRDRYFGAASSNPLTVFPTLNRLKNHHLAKLENRGRARNLEKLIGEIVDGLSASQPFPPSMGLADQGRFAVGYYHQRQHPSTYRTPTDSETKE